MGSKDCMYTHRSSSRPTACIEKWKRKSLLLFLGIYYAAPYMATEQATKPSFLSPFMILFLALAHGRRFYFPVVVERCRLHVIPFGHQGCLFPFTFCAKTIASEYSTLLRVIFSYPSRSYVLALDSRYKTHSYAHMMVVHKYTRFLSCHVGNVLPIRPQRLLFDT